MPTRLMAGLLALALGMNTVAADRKFINAEQGGAAQATRPISDAVLVGNTLYISGHLGIDPATNRAATDPAVEAKLVMDRVKHTVEAAGLSMDDVVSIQVFCTDLALYETFNNVYRTYFPHGFPARAFLGVNTLLRGSHFEVLGVAVRK
ncbi:MAG: 2-iminobutanoate/2-iminopropanoate deaminase [Gammaproteobacteria bacterium]|nr:2-iminobutanoate/2-iminopropanoate deaminase [Gammaproteobacteria bacterium]